MTLDLTYLPALGYLSVVTVLVLGPRRCPAWVHLVALMVGLAIRMLTTPSLLAVAAPVAVAGALFVGGVLALSRLLSGVSLFSLVTALALLPFDGWLSVVVGIGVAAVVGVIRTVRVLGADRVNVLTMETMGAMGVNPAGSFHKPDASRLLNRADAVDVGTDTVQARGLRMHLPPYLLVGVLLGLLISGL